MTFNKLPLVFGWIGGGRESDGFLAVWRVVAENAAIGLAVERNALAIVDDDVVTRAAHLLDFFRRVILVLLGHGIIGRNDNGQIQIVISGVHAMAALQRVEEAPRVKRAISEVDAAHALAGLRG